MSFCCVCELSISLLAVLATTARFLEAGRSSGTVDCFPEARMDGMPCDVLWQGTRRPCIMHVGKVLCQASIQPQSSSPGEALSIDCDQSEYMSGLSTHGQLEMSSDTDLADILVCIGSRRREQRLRCRELECAILGAIRALQLLRLLPAECATRCRRDGPPSCSRLHRCRWLREAHRLLML